MRHALTTIAAVIFPVLFAFTHAHGFSAMDYVRPPLPVLLQPFSTPAVNLSPGAYQVTGTLVYGYEHYNFKHISSLHLHAGGIRLSVSGAFAESVGWNIALGVVCPGGAAKHLELRLGSCMIPFSASFAWRFAGRADSSNGSFFAGFSYSYATLKGSYHKYLPAPPRLLYLIKMDAPVSLRGSTYELFAGLKPSLQIVDNISIRAIVAYRIIFDTSVLDYRLHTFVLNEPGQYQGPLYFKFRQTRDPGKPIHGMLLGLELDFYGAGMHGMMQVLPKSRRFIYGFGLSYTHSFNAKKTDEKNT